MSSRKNPLTNLEGIETAFDPQPSSRPARILALISVQKRMASTAIPTMSVPDSPSRHHPHPPPLLIPPSAIQPIRSYDLASPSSYSISRLSRPLKQDASALTSASNARTRGPAPFKPRSMARGAGSYQLRQFAEATLGSGSLRKAVRLPEGEDLNEWLAVNGGLS